MTYDVIVAGGGPSGTMAALSAARLGLRTLLIERYGFLGGMNTAGLVGPLMTFCAGSLQIVRGIPGAVMDRLRSLGGTPGHLVDPIWARTSMTPVDTELFKWLLLDEVRQAGADLLLHSTVVEAARDGARLSHLTVANKRGLSRVTAPLFIDATGDGDLAAACGCKFVMGRERDGLTQPMTLIFKMAGVDVEAVRTAVRRSPENFHLGVPLDTYLALPGLAVSGFYEEVRRGKGEGVFPFDRDRVLFFGLPHAGDVTVNTLRLTRVNGTNPADLTRAEATLRAQVPALASFLQRHVPGFSCARVTETATQVGVRETRHIVGEYLLTARDVLEQTAFADVIAHAAYPIDLHSPDGSGMTIRDPRADRPESFYDIPLRCLVPAGIDNLIVTGRCLSADHEASASSRISAACMAQGEAAGATAYHVIEDGCARVRDVDAARVQRTLIERHGAYLEVRA